MENLEFYQAGNVTLQSGEVLKGAQLAWQSFGTLNAARDNAVVLFSYYGGTHRHYHSLIGPGRVLDPERWFIVLLNLFGNGVSTSPSNSPLQPGSNFPKVTLIDNINVQYRLLIDELGIQRIALAAGWSMGAMQAWHWAASWPERVKNMLAVCGSARCWPLNQVFLHGVKAALLTDPAFQQGDYLQPPAQGLAAFGRVYAGWAYSARFYREEGYRELGFDTLEEFLQFWEADHQQADANDLLAMLHAWQMADIGLLPGCQGSSEMALRRIEARTIVMPCDTDQYFTLEESRLECQFLQRGILRPLYSRNGHCAGAPGRFSAETAQIEDAMAALLA